MSLVKKMGILLCILGLVVSFLVACAGASQDNQEPPAAEEPTPPQEPETEQPDQAAEQDPELVAQGEEVVQESCISCHGQNLEGGYGPSLQGVSERYSPDEIKDILVNGKGTMSGGLAQGHEEAVIAYLLTLQ